MPRGFTLIELILVVGLLMIITASAVPLSGNWYFLNSYDSAKSTLISSLRKSQAYALDQKGDFDWGVCLIGRTIRLFSSSCTSPVVKNDFLLPDFVTITGLSTVTFSPLSGEPSAPQSIILTGHDKTTTITINSLGGFDIN